MAINMAVNMAINLPSPALFSKHEDGEPSSLSDRINTSTRSAHAQLNRLIIARLPLALPPNTINTSAYVSGLLHIAPIYINFESLWEGILSPCLRIKQGREVARDSRDGKHTETGPHNPSRLSNSSRLPVVHQFNVCNKTNSILSRLRLPGLLRSKRLRSDIQTLSGISEQEFDKRQQIISHNCKVSDFVEHTTRSVVANPHVILAYAWVMYMALFSGGRYLRASLQKAGTEFWLRSPCQNSSSSVHSQDIYEQELSGVPSPLKRRNSRSESLTPRGTRGLEFFHFDGEEDGEDIKREFKKRFAEADILLSKAEKEDIIQEAQHVFAFMIEMIGELDRQCGSMDGKIKQNHQQNAPAVMQDPDGISTAKEKVASQQGPCPEGGNARRSSIIRLGSQIIRSDADLSHAHPQALWQSLREIAISFSRNVPGITSLGTSKHDDAMNGILDLWIDPKDTFIVFVLYVIVALAVWYFALY